MNNQQGQQDQQDQDRKAFNSPDNQNACFNPVDNKAENVFADDMDTRLNDDVDAWNEGDAPEGNSSPYAFTEPLHETTFPPMSQASNQQPPQSGANSSLLSAIPLPQPPQAIQDPLLQQVLNMAITTPNTQNSPLPVPAAALPIAGFDTTTVPPGHKRDDIINVRAKMIRHLNRNVGDLCLGGARLLDNRYFAVGTCDDEAKEHYLMVFDSNGMKFKDQEPLISSLRINECISDSHFLPTKTDEKKGFLVAMTGEGFMTVYDIDGNNNHAITQAARIRLHTHYVREMAFNLELPALLATGGYSGNLMVHDMRELDRPQVIFSAPHQRECVSSVQWSSGANQTVSCTLDSGAYLLYDVRSQAQPLAIRINTGTSDLYCHLQLSEHGVVTGGLDGIQRTFDLRRPQRAIDETKVPGVKGIGEIRMNDAKNAVVTSGCQDFVVWRQPPACSRPQFWSNSSGGSTGTFSASFFNDNTILTTSSTGSIGMYTQDYMFDIAGAEKLPE